MRQRTRALLGHEQSETVRPGLCDISGANRAAGTAAVLDDELLAPGLSRKMPCHDPGKNVGCAAGPERNNGSDSPIGPGEWLGRGSPCGGGTQPNSRGETPKVAARMNGNAPPAARFFGRCPSMERRWAYRQGRVAGARTGRASLGPTPMSA